MELEIGRLYKEGKSAQQVAEALGIGMKTVYRKLSKLNIPRRNQSEQNKIRFEAKSLTFNFKEQLTPNEKELMLSALMLYKGEGAKTGNTVDFVNSDEKSLRVFMRFLREICFVDESKIRIYLYCFSDQNCEDIISFWTKSLSVPKEQFTKPYVRETDAKSKRKLPTGVIHIRYNDKKLLVKILHMCEKVLDDLLV